MVIFFSRATAPSSRSVPAAFLGGGDRHDERGAQHSPAVCLYGARFFPFFIPTLTIHRRSFWFFVFFPFLFFCFVRLIPHRNPYTHHKSVIRAPVLHSTATGREGGGGFGHTLAPFQINPIKSKWVPAIFRSPFPHPLGQVAIHLACNFDPWEMGDSLQRTFPENRTSTCLHLNG